MSSSATKSSMSMVLVERGFISSSSPGSKTTYLPFDVS